MRYLSRLTWSSTPHSLSQVDQLTIRCNLTEIISDDLMDTQALQHTLREFAAARNWQPFHTPKNLSTALMVEAAELAEIFQWMTPEESRAANRDAATQERIADEVADVLLYLLQLVDHCAIDLDRAVAHKLIKNAVKHPVAPESTP